jgi:hypothetical protein
MISTWLRVNSRVLSDPTGLKIYFSEYSAFARFKISHVSTIVDIKMKVTVAVERVDV